VASHAHFISLAILAGALFAVPGCTGDPLGPDGFETVSPESVGFSSADLQVAKAQFDRIGSAAFMALYDGKVFISWGEVDRKYLLHSIRKPLLGSLYGIAVADGTIDTTATLAQLGIDDIAPSLTDAEKEARVIHLLRARSGVYHPAAAETEDMEAERPARGSHAPDTFFYYNNWDFNALGTIYEQETGAGIFEAFKREIADPIGMQDFAVTDGYYKYEPEKSAHPAYHFRMTARDLARFGVLYQQHGRWGGRQIVPQSWIDASWKTYSVEDTTLGLGYGLLWATMAADSPLGVGPAVLHGGLALHYLLIKPQDRLVFVHRVDTDHPWTVTTDDIGELFQLVLAARRSP
jgi:CubicO group peptidase (beta-lactamase class C family)